VVTSNEKVCAKCLQSKPKSAFGPRKRAADGLSWTCRDCNSSYNREIYRKNSKEMNARTVERRRKNPTKSRAAGARFAARNPQKIKMWRRYHLIKKYGITEEDYQRMFDEQNGGCAICGGTKGKNGRLHIDHNHATGKVRGLLCSPCNVAIGMLRENPALFQKAQDYIARGVLK